MGTFKRSPHLVASLQVLHFVGKFLGLAMTLMFKLLDPSLNLLVQLLQLLYVVLKFFQQPMTAEKRYFTLRQSHWSKQHIVNSQQTGKHTQILFSKPTRLNMSY